MTDNFAGTAYASNKPFATCDVVSDLKDLNALMVKMPSYLMSPLYMSDEVYAMMQKEMEKSIVKSMGIPPMLFGGPSLYGIPVYKSPGLLKKTYTDDLVPVAAPVRVEPRPLPFQPVVHGWQVAVMFAVGAVILGLLFTVV